MRRRCAEISGEYGELELYERIRESVDTAAVDVCARWCEEGRPKKTQKKRKKKAKKKGKKKKKMMKKGKGDL